MSGAAGTAEVDGPGERHRARRLAPHVGRAWRDERTLQFELSSPAVALTGLDHGDRHLLRLLERGASPAALATDARRRGVRPGRGHDLVALLEGQGLLVGTDGSGTTEQTRLDAESWCWRVAQGPARARAARERPARGVVVSGGSGLAVVLASAFAASGVGAVAVRGEGVVGPCDVLPGGPVADDVGRRLQDAAADALGRVARGLRRPRASPDLGVLVGRDAVDAPRAAAWLAADVPHLPVLVRGADLVIGPLVAPGRGPCLHCVDLRRRDLDPAWPRIVDQLRRPPQAPVAVLPALVGAATTITLLLGLAALDGGAAQACGVSATVSAPLAAPTWRRWRAHPECGCHSVTGAPAGPRPVSNSPGRLSPSQHE